MAWNLTDEERAAVVRKSRNGAGTSYVFADGSRAFVPAGTADVRVMATEDGRPI